VLSTVQNHSKETARTVCPRALLDMMQGMEMAPSPSYRPEDSPSVGRPSRLAVPGDQRTWSKGQLKRRTLVASRGKAAGAEQRAESRKEEMPAGKQLMV